MIAYDKNGRLYVNVVFLLLVIAVICGGNVIGNLIGKVLYNRDNRKRVFNDFYSSVKYLCGQVKDLRQEVVKLKKQGK